MNQETFEKELAKLNVILSDQNLKDLNTYKNLLLEYNQKFNLTAIKQDEEIYLKHFYDSLTLTKIMDLNHEYKLLDIGTGAGFPGLVLKIFYPKLNITLLDSNNKKITFLNKVIEELKLENITCIHARAEELNNSFREHFDIITSRAVASLRVLTELSIPYLKVNGIFLVMKGNVEEELEEAKTTIKKLNSEIESITSFNLPIENSKRTIIKIKKLAETSNIYPRKYDQIIKKTLK